MFQKRYAKAYWKQQLKIRSQGKCFSPFSTQNTVSATTMPLLAGGQIIGLPQVICFLRLQVFSASRSTVAQWPKKYAHISLLKVLIIKEDVRKSEDSVIFHFLVWQLRYSPVPTVTSACQLIIMIHLLGMKSRIKIFFFSFLHKKLWCFSSVPDPTHPSGHLGRSATVSETQDGTDSEQWLTPAFLMGYEFIRDSADPPKPLSSLHFLMMQSIEVSGWPLLQHVLRLQM